ncbi:MAG: hypothetical protein FWE92_02405 [Defluviitaleaceae bacterium]|nr:hypothetical protein [Defluviitaleaceae bacterium]
MCSILEEFAYGNIPPKRQSFTPDSMYGQAVRSVSANEEKLLNKSGREEKITFQKYVDAQRDLNELTAVRNLACGYKLGLLMTAEAFITGGQLIAGEEYDASGMWSK